MTNIVDWDKKREWLLSLQARAEMCAEATLPGAQLRVLLRMALVGLDVVCRGHEVGMDYNNPLYVTPSTFREWVAALDGHPHEFFSQCCGASERSGFGGLCGECRGSNSFVCECGATRTDRYSPIVEEPT